MAEGLLFKTCRGPVTVLARETQEIMFMKRFLEPVFEASITCGLVGVLIHYETAGVYMRTKQLGYNIIASCFVPDVDFQESTQVILASKQCETCDSVFLKTCLQSTQKAQSPAHQHYALKMRARINLSVQAAPPTTG